MSVWISLAVETRELPCGESETHLPLIFLALKRKIWDQTYSNSLFNFYS